MSSSLAPWQRASSNSTAKPATNNGTTEGNIMLAFAPQPCITNMAGALKTPGTGTNQANSVLPFGPGK